MPKVVTAAPGKQRAARVAGKRRSSVAAGKRQAAATGRPAKSPDDVYREARAKRERARAEQEMLALRRARGELMQTSDHITRMSRFAAAVASRLDRYPEAVCARLRGRCETEWLKVLDDYFAADRADLEALLRRLVAEWEAGDGPPAAK